MKFTTIWTTFFLLVQWTLAISYDKAVELAKKDGLLHINDKNYRQLFKNDNYGFIIFLTAEDNRVGCTLCHQFGPQYKAIANQYMQNLQDPNNDLTHVKDSKNDKERVIFGYADFMSSRKLFEELKLTAVPRLFYYEPGKAPQMSEFTTEFSFLSVENTDGYTRWIQQNVNGLNAKSLDVIIPPSKSMVYTTIIVGLVLITVIYQFKNPILSFIQSKTLWEFACLALIILCISGNMYNQIRNPQSYRTDKEGHITYFATGHNQQYGAETQILSIIYAAISAGLLALLQIFPNMKSSSFRIIGIGITSVTIFVLYSYMVEFYSLKAASYPFHLLPVSPHK